ncbi:MAG: hypothetical protein A3A43_00835 [Candidatus Liptonbacteria bacterium RIFCSPLOWO2_01_FULL_56_20]|uniref:Uncharacterized protein n=1 Tax=Candidatus Liptonbacteria bacterium RIFCSPLOWO2_01_FULL_56_20 TaxID=1798652 RepID=A0A1G2CHN4_9BACT|nr:MAG: hypothetical protein UY96_C0020G0007 [Parcubacteria group bacterium GW2011_GWB1_56_8]OGY98317.1 MAG: hypothetical protein A2681_01325 [Candidatus Liptonbacteria bacterium RIFCSPHIGHO2_01_FULL_56_18b]OGZ00722.1 MAG: hypothetical protein A3A43_00835 [Candidatus Liptonbacteria bacterium RIFCSPLOWO2_01_FULL_56_20]
MAIIIEEEKNRVGIVGFIGWLVVIAVIAAALYYVFFKQPELIEVDVPENVRNAEELSQKITLNPDAVVQSPAFQALKRYVTPSAPATLGRQNPFLGF